MRAVQRVTRAPRGVPASARALALALALAAAPAGAQDFPAEDAATPASPAPAAPPPVPAPIPPEVGPGVPVPDPAAAPDPAAPPPATPLPILDRLVLPGTRVRLSWSPGEGFSGGEAESPVVIVHGAMPGPVVCLTAGIHGDEINGIEIARRVAYALDPEVLRGTVISVPVVNVFGYTRGSRYLPDRRDLNRFFPGSRYGSVASRIAYAFFDGVVRHCDSLVDLHTGSFDRMNLPQLRADLTDPGVLAFVRGFSDTVVLHSPGSRGMLRTAAVSAGIPAVTFEVGGPARLQPAEIDVAVAALERLLEHQGLLGALPEALASDAAGAADGAATGVGPQDGEAGAPGAAEADGAAVDAAATIADPSADAAPPHDPLGAAVEASASQPIFFESRWVRANDGGLLISEVELGQRVRPGEVMGRVVDPMDNRQTDIRAPFFGRVIGMAQNQQVLPGFAAYHLGEETSEARAVEEAGTAPAPDAEVEAEAEDGSASLEPEEGDG